MARRAGKGGRSARLAAGLADAIGYGLSVALAAVYGLYLRQDLADVRALTFLVIAAVGAATAHGATQLLLATPRAPNFPSQRLALAVALLAVGTLAMTSLIFGLHFRLTDPDGHAPFATLAWWIETAFSLGGSTAQYLVIGVPLTMPYGLFFLLAASFRLARAGTCDYRTRDISPL